MLVRRKPNRRRHHRGERAALAGHLCFRARAAATSATGVPYPSWPVHPRPRPHHRDTRGGRLSRQLLRCVRRGSQHLRLLAVVDPERGQYHWALLPALLLARRHSSLPSDRQRLQRDGGAFATAEDSASVLPRAGSTPSPLAVVGPSGSYRSSRLTVYRYRGQSSRGGTTAYRLPPCVFLPRVHTLRG